MSDYTDGDRTENCRHCKRAVVYGLLDTDMLCTKCRVREPFGDHTIVHHIDGNPRNNDIDNLAIMDAQDHRGRSSSGE